MKPYGTRIKDFLRARGLSQRDFCRRHGLNESQFSEYTTGRTYPGEAVVLALDAEGMNIRYLFAGKGEIVVVGEEDRAANTLELIRRILDEHYAASGVSDKPTVIRESYTNVGESASNPPLIADILEMYNRGDLVPRHTSKPSKPIRQ